MVVVSVDQVHTDVQLVLEGETCIFTRESACNVVDLHFVTLNGQLLGAPECSVFFDVKDAVLAFWLQNS